MQGDSVLRKDVGPEVRLLGGALGLLHAGDGGDDAARFQVLDGVGQYIEQVEIELFLGRHGITSA